MRRSWAAAAAVAVLGVAGTSAALAGGLAAGAAMPHYTVTTAGTGIELRLGGTTFVGAASSASAGTGAPVEARGQGEVSPDAVATAQAAAATPGASQTRPRTCAQPSTPFPAPFATVVSIGVACGSASATMRPTGMPSASGAGSVASLTVGPPAGSTVPAELKRILPTSVTQGSSLGQKLETALGTLPALPTTGLPLGTVLQKVAAASSSSVTSLVSASVGPSTSTVTTTGSTVTTTSTDTGATVSLLDGLGAGGGALLTVSVGRADTTADANLAAGTTGATATGSAVTVTVSPPTGAAKTVSVTPGAAQSFLTGTPLETTVSVGAPTATAGDGTASASGIDIDLAEGVGAATGAGGVVLELGASTAHATVTAPPAAASSTVTPPSSAASTTPATLTGATTVHTGEPWSGPLPFVLLGLSLLAGIGLLARRRLVAAAHLAGRIAGHTPPVTGPASHHPAGPGLRDLLRSPSGSGSGSAVIRSGSPGSTAGGLPGAAGGGPGAAPIGTGPVDGEA